MAESPEKNNEPEIAIPVETQERLLNAFLERADDAVQESHRLANRITEAHLTLRMSKRRFWFFFFLAVVCAIMIHDIHVGNCMVYGQPDSELEATICDITFPIHTHGPSTEGEPESEWWTPIPWVVVFGGTYFLYRRKDKHLRNAEKRVRQDTADSKSKQEERGYL